MLLTPALRDDIAKHALEEYPRECCGLIVGNAYVPCTNIAPAPEEQFLIRPRQYAQAAASGILRAVVHSHRPEHGPDPSDNDRAAQAATRIPWVIALCNGQECNDFTVFAEEIS